MAKGFSITIDDDMVTPMLDRLSRLDAEDCVIATANELGTAAKKAAPRQPGDGGGGLAKSTRVEVRGARATVGYTADYAPHVEYGHRQNVGQFVPGLGSDGKGRRLVRSFIPGQHFFRPCVERARSTFRQRIREALQEAAS